MAELGRHGETSCPEIHDRSWERTMTLILSSQYLEIGWRLAGDWLDIIAMPDSGQDGQGLPLGSQRDLGSGLHRHPGKQRQARLAPATHQRVGMDGGAKVIGP
ncbi:MAG: hypothetical protein VKL58_04855 [Cyanobacteriota bacterium]|nr:hypothetical protein [Cyanobacteriota bacterium]